MGDYRVVCVHKTPRGGHEHITGVGVGAGPGEPDEEMSVAEVYESMASGNRYFIRDPETGEVGWLRPEQCCGVDTLTTAPAEAAADALARCETTISEPRQNAPCPSESI